MNIFIAGARAVHTLNDDITFRLHNVLDNKYSVLVGDANGIDKAVQKFFSDNQYSNVTIYAANGKARNNIYNWKVNGVNVDGGVKGFEFYAAKDFAMAKDCDYGFMIWNGESKGTLNNIINLIKLGKTTLVYYTPNKKFCTIKTKEDLKILTDNFKNSSKAVIEMIDCKNQPVQLTLNMENVQSQIG